MVLKKLLVAVFIFFNLISINNAMEMNVDEFKINLKLNTYTRKVTGVKWFYASRTILNELQKFTVNESDYFKKFGESFSISNKIYDENGDIVAKFKEPENDSQTYLCSSPKIKEMFNGINIEKGKTYTIIVSPQDHKPRPDNAQAEGETKCTWEIEK